MATLFFRNRQLLLLFISLICLWGLSAFFTLPRLEDPEITQRVATVTTLFPGAKAERVEALVTDPIERELAEVEEIDHLESVSRPGISIITVNLKESVKQVDEVWARVRDRLNDAVPQLPEGTSEPIYEDREVKANAVMIGLTWEFDSSVNYAVLRRLAEKLETQLRYLPGTDTVEIFGAPQEEIRVEIRPEALAMLGLTVTDVSQQILASDAKTSAGQLRSSGNDLVLEIAGELESVERIRQIPIRTSEPGQTTLLSDIATIEKGIVEPQNQLAIVAGYPAIVIAATVESDMQINTWDKQVQQMMQSFQSELSDKIGLHLILSQNPYVQRRINGVLAELLTGAILSMIVMLLIMGWRSSIVVTASLPLAILLVLGVMQLLKVPLHQMSLTGLVIAIGLLIDNAIVMADEVEHRLTKGMAPIAAVRDSVASAALPLTSSTMTTALAFTPIAVTPGSVGEFTGTIGISGILGITSSLILSLTVLPALSCLLYAWRISDRLPRWLQTGFSYPQLTQRYRYWLTQALRYPKRAIALSLVIPILGFTLAPTLTMQFFPPAGRDQFYLEVELPNSAAIAQTQSTVQQMRDLMLRYPEVKAVHWFVGASAPTFYYNVIGVRENAADYAQGLVQLHPNVLSRPVMQSLQAELNAAFPQAQVIVRQIEQGPPFDAPIEMRLYGPDLAELQQWGDRLRLELAQRPEVVHSRADLSETTAKLAVHVDEIQARLVGLDRFNLAQQLDATLEGTTGGSVLEATEELPVRVRLGNSDRSELTQIQSLDLLPTAPSDRTLNQTIPLSGLATIQLESDRTAIPRRNGRRVNIVQGFLQAGELPANVLVKFQQQLQANHFQLPPGYTYEWGGEVEERRESTLNILRIMPVIAVLIAATLIFTFQSVPLAGGLGLIAVLSAGVGLLALRISGYPFGFTAILGTIGLVGIGVNESTVMLAALQNDMPATQGDRSAIQEVVVQNTRHLVATTVTDTVGFVPLMFDPTGFWNPLAIVIGGGLVGVTFLSVCFVPALFLLNQHQPSVHQPQCCPQSDKPPFELY